MAPRSRRTTSSRLSGAAVRGWTRRAWRAELVAAARLDGVFGQRWKSETVISVIKRKFGDAIRARLRRLQLREPVIKGLVYILHV